MRHLDFAWDEADERLTPELVLVCPELAGRAKETAGLTPSSDDIPAVSALAAPAEGAATDEPVATAAPELRPHSTVVASADDGRARRRSWTRPSFLLPRVFALTVIWLLATSTFTLAAGNGKRKGPPPAPKAPSVLTVPDVRGQPYVFAKGMLDDGGFAWRVEGDVQGYAANFVAMQHPAPGVDVVDTGAPMVVLRLARNGEYEERGLPQNASPHEGTVVELASRKRERGGDTAGSQSATSDDPEAGATRKYREPDFRVRGAPREPAAEMPLPKRARLLRARLLRAEKRTDALLEQWLYQHAWIVTGARFGWSGGADALRILIRLDEELQARWGVGARSEAVARAALAEVKRKTK